jgi:hypothetical protein
MYKSIKFIPKKDKKEKYLQIPHVLANIYFKRE